MNTKSMQSFENCKRYIEKQDPWYLTLLPLYFIEICIMLLNNEFVFNVFTSHYWQYIPFDTCTFVFLFV